MLRKRKLRGDSTPNPYHQEIRRHAGALISIANRAESACIKSGEPTISETGEVIMPRELLSAQQKLVDSLRSALILGNSFDDIQARVFEPVLESSVVGDVAWLVMQNIIAQAKQQRALLRKRL